LVVRLRVFVPFVIDIALLLVLVGRLETVPVTVAAVGALAVMVWPPTEKCDALVASLPVSVPILVSGAPLRPMLQSVAIDVFDFDFVAREETDCSKEEGSLINWVLGPLVRSRGAVRPARRAFCMIYRGSVCILSQRA
jgi:hypothetical protein